MSETKVLPSEALFGFMGWLTSRGAVSGPFSASHDASSAAELVAEFVKSQGWEMPRDEFPKMLAEYPASPEPLTTDAPTPRETGAERVVIEVMTVGMFSDGPNADACVCCPGAHRFGVEKRILSCTPPEAMPEAHYRRDLLSIISDFAWALPDQSRFTITLEQPTPRPDAARASVTEAMVEAAYRVMRDEYHDRALISPCSVRMSLEAALAAAPVPSASVTEAAAALLAKLDHIFESPEYVGVFSLAQLHGGPYRGPQCADEMAALRTALAAAPRDAGREEDRNDAERYRALRRGATLALTEDAGLTLCVDFVEADEDGDDPTEHPMTERNAPFLTAEERSHLNGDRVESRGYVRDADAIDRAADFVREALRAARRGGAA